MIIKAFYHIYLTQHWYTIVSEQMRILLTSGLYDECEEISIGCVGHPNEKELLERLFVNLYPKLKIKYFNVDHRVFEFPTLKLIEEDKSEYVGFYFHTKGVTRWNDTLVNHWRSWLNESILNRWQDHRNNVQIGYDVSSVNHCMPPLHPEHFSGNFWWFNREYINRLPKIDSLNHSHRWAAEQWICKGGGNYFAEEFKESGRDLFLMNYEKKD